MLMCADFSSWAYNLQPNEKDWLWRSATNPQIPELNQTAWADPNYPPVFYADAEWGLFKIPSQTHLFMAVNPDTHKVVIAFRGSVPFTLLYDVLWYRKMVSVDGNSATQAAELVVWGYQQETIKTALERDLPRYIQAAGGPGKATVYITGHSLGAALAAFAAYELVKGGRLSGVAAVKVITFASPVIGNAAFAVSYNNLKIPTYRALVPNDPIDRLRVRWWQDADFTDVGNLIALPSGTDWSPGGTGNHLLATYRSSIVRWQRTVSAPLTDALESKEATP